MKNSVVSSRESSIKKLSELIAGIKVAMLTTLTDDDRELHTRPMVTQSLEQDGTLWFFTRMDSPKSQEVRKDSHIAVSYSDPDDSRYVAVYGRAAVVQDRDRAESLWTPSLGAWFPRGLEDPELALLKVTVDRVEYWDIGTGKMMPIEAPEAADRTAA